MKARWTCLVLVAGALALATPAFPKGPFELLDPSEAARLLGEAGDVEEYPDANSITVFDRTWVEFEETGAYEEYNYALVKILTQEGVDREGDPSFSYHRRYGTLDVLEARVIKADGTIVPVPEDLISDGTAPELAAIDIYESDMRQLTVVFPQVEPGDAIEYIVFHDYEPLLKNGFNGIYFLQYIDPILESTVSVTGPEDLPLTHVLKDGEAEFEEVRDGGKITYTWRVRDTEQIEREPLMASPAQFATRVIVSTIPTWEELSRYVWKMSDEKCVAEDAVKELVADLTDGLETTEEKIRAIHFWIAKNIRYLGVAMDRGAFVEPHYAEYTLEKEYGVCRDKAVLMVTMLEEIGVPAWVVFINPSRRADPEVPTLFFEHGIVAIEGPDGDYLYIDPTLEESREVYASYAGDRWVLVATEEGQSIRRVPHSPAAENAGTISEASTLGADGGISGRVTVSGAGIYEIVLRTIAKTAGGEQLRMMWEQSVQEVYPGTELASFDITDYEDLDRPLTVSLGFEIEDYALDADPYLLFRVPTATGAFDVLSGLIMGRFTTLPERKTPIAIGSTVGAVSEATVLIPRGYVVESLPDEIHFREGVVVLNATYEFVPTEEPGAGNAVRYRQELLIDAFEVSPDDYLALKEASRLASRSSRGEVILRREGS